MKRRMKGPTGFVRGAGLLTGIVLVLAAGNGWAQLAKTPPMGFNTWNGFGCNMSQDTLQALADAIAANGMMDAGYTYVNIDDCWEGSRGADGFIAANDKWTGNALKSAARYGAPQSISPPIGARLPASSTSR